MAYPFDVLHDGSGDFQRMLGVLPRDQSQILDLILAISSYVLHGIAEIRGQVRGDIFGFSVG